MTHQVTTILVANRVVNRAENCRSARADLPLGGSVWIFISEPVPAVCLRDLDWRDLDRRDLDRRYLDQRDLDRRYLDQRDLDRRYLDQRDLDRRYLDQRDLDRWDLNRQLVSTLTKNKQVPWSISMILSYLYLEIWSTMLPKDYVYSSTHTNELLVTYTSTYWISTLRMAHRVELISSGRNLGRFYFRDKIKTIATREKVEIVVSCYCLTCISCFIFNITLSDVSQVHHQHMPG